MPEDIKLGKNLIESLTLGMYDDSKFIFREYVQNSCDQIDAAVKLGILNSRRIGTVFITIDPKKKQIIIEDNATGIRSDEFYQKLTDIAASDKDREVDKGFRGIGRLGGLAYCETLIFESSFINESMGNQLIFDAEEMRRILVDSTINMEAADLIKKITQHKTFTEEKGKHYFKVTLNNVNNEELLDIGEVRGYLSMVAPVPFDNKFIFKDHIKNHFKEIHNYSIDEYNIFVNTEEVYKAYTTSIYEQLNGNRKKIDEIFDVKFFSLAHETFGPFAVGWYGISTAINQLPKINVARGIRLRKGNIQIGSEDTMMRFYKDGRFHFYYFGEIHTLNKGLIPNSRRDYFDKTETCAQFEHEIRSYFNTKIHKLTRDASEINSAVKKIEKYQESQKEYERRTEEGFTSHEEKIALEKDLDKKKNEANVGLQTLKKFKDKSEEDETLQKLYNKVVKGTHSISEKNPAEKKTVFRTDKLSKLSNKERKLISRVFSIIKHVLTPDLAENLIKKIEEDFK